MVAVNFSLGRGKSEQTSVRKSIGCPLSLRKQRTYGRRRIFQKTAHRPESPAYIPPTNWLTFQITHDMVKREKLFLKTDFCLTKVITHHCGFGFFFLCYFFVCLFWRKVAFTKFFSLITYLFFASIPSLQPSTHSQPASFFSFFISHGAFLHILPTTILKHPSWFFCLLPCVWSTFTCIFN